MRRTEETAASGAGRRAGCARGREVGRRRAFTMVELMVVIVVIIILATITLGLANRVTESGKQTLTQNTIRGLEQVLTSHKANAGVRPPSLFKDDIGHEFPMIDARLNGAGTDAAELPDSSLAFFLLEATRQSGDVDAILKGIDAKLVKKLPLVSGAGRNPEIDGVEVTEAVTVVDGWNRPIRFVHPSYDGGAGQFYDGSAMASGSRPTTIDVMTDSGTLQYRRSYRPFDPNVAGPDDIGDADEGICIDKNPYFYSAGVDGDPGTRGDNVYGVQPRFPDKTMDLK